MTNIPETPFCTILALIEFFSWMQMVSGFEPLFENLVYIRHLSLVRPAVPVATEPIHCWSSFYFTIDQNNDVVYSTDIKPAYTPKLTGEISFHLSRISL